MTIKAMKQMVSALESRICSDCFESEFCCAPVIKDAIKTGRQAIAKAEKQEPVSDNWQQYAKEGETAQDVIERTRADSDAFIKLYINKETPKSELNAMYCRGRDDGFEAGRQQGMKQERSLWELSRIGQEIEADAEKQEQGEPVAKVVLTESLGLPCLQWLDLNRQFDFKGGEYLYTHPQPRKPLTDEQIEEIFGIHNDEDERYALHWERDIVRQIEAAHGIKE